MSVFLSLLLFALRQNAELAKLRQECTKLTKELGEKTESLLADEHIRKGLEAKVSATEKQLSLQQVGSSSENIIFMMNYFRHDQLSTQDHVVDNLHFFLNQQPDSHLSPRLFNVKARLIVM